MNITGKDLLAVGFPAGPAMGEALKLLPELVADPHYGEMSREVLLQTMQRLAVGELVSLPASWVAVTKLLPVYQPQQEVVVLRPKPWDRWQIGTDIEEGAQEQLRVAMRLPISMDGALLPDAHQGYGLPIGGVLATDNAIIPYAVGVDIGCRMQLSVLGVNLRYLEDTERLSKVLREFTRFGDEREHLSPNDDAVLNSRLFREIPILKTLQHVASRQFGTSGGGNHFVEFGQVDLKADNSMGLPEGSYVGLLSHSGSRGFGASIADHYSKIASSLRVMPAEAKNLAWLNMDTEAGQEYWLAMNLAGDYAAACHRDIHKRVLGGLGVGVGAVLGTVTNAHNLAWKETYEGQEHIVHRKGATPAGLGVPGIIPGSMATEAYLVRGTGQRTALQSASHGAGRRMSRTVAKLTITQVEMDAFLADRGITLIGAGLDESPQAYKDIKDVMYQQRDLVTIDGTFQPKVVRMAPPEKDKPWAKKKPVTLGE